MTNSDLNFEIICVNCDTLGILIDYPEGAPPSTLVKCCHCNAPRGTLGALRRLAQSDRKILLEVDDVT
jgi:hypothetical protein